MKKLEKDNCILDDGFSSEEEVKHEEIIVTEENKPDHENALREIVKFKIPPPEQIKVKSYSLSPDIATGWAPKNELPVPIPLLFDNRRVDIILKRILQKKQEKMKVVYLGPRYENTFYAWYDKHFEFPYPHIRAPHNMKFSNRSFCGQHWDAEDGVIFDSFFESGNLDVAIQVDDHEYDIYIRVDSNTRGHLQWFNFKAKNLEKLQKYKFNICNLEKHKSLYSRGQKPYIFSARKYQKQKISWEQAGDSLKFQQKAGKSAKVLNTEFCSNYKLSFEYYTEYQKDTIQIAYCIPYTYTQLKQYLSGLQKSTESKRFLTTSKLCQTLGGLDIPLLTIHENFVKENQARYAEEKKCVIVSARVHPGESNGSHMMQGFLDFLCGDSREAKEIRANFIFKVVPMLNPDGVILGNYRTGVSGRDFNREYRNPDKMVFPQVFAFKKFVIENKTLYRQNLLMFLDFHGHSTKKNVFVYGPQFPIIQKHYYQCRVFPKLIGNHTNMFRYYSCSFKVSQFKQTTARAVFLRKVMIPLSYTIQASNGCFYDQNTLKDVQFTQRSWLEMGKRIGTALNQYCQLVVISEKNRISRIHSRKAKKDIKIRKNSKNKVNVNLPNDQSYDQEVSTFLGNSNNEKIIKILEEIKYAEIHKEVQKNEEDQISEGSSDGEGDKDDLSPQKLNLLFQIIKNKNSIISEKHRNRFNEQEIKHSKTNEHEEEILELKPIQIIMADSEKEKPEESLRGSQNGKGYFLKHRNIPFSFMQSEQKREKVAAKIINFSFVGSKQALSLERKCTNTTRNGHSQQKDRSHYDVGELRGKGNNYRVLDLSDNLVRQAFTGSSTEVIKRQGDRRNLTFVNVSPRRMGVARIEDYRIKRLFIDEFKI